MQPTRPTPRKGAKFLDAKILIVTLSLAITIGFWNLFSNHAIQSAQSASGDNSAESAQPPANVSAGGPPLPTLVPLVDVTIPDTNGAMAAPVQGGVQAAPLRAVAVPTLEIVQKHNPIVGQAVQASSGNNGGGGGGGGGGGQPPVTSTHSSK